MDNPPQAKNIIFDWSGTISDDLEQVFRTTMDVFREYKADEISLDQFRKTFVLPYMEFYRLYIPDISKSRADRLFKKFYKNYPEPRPFRETERVLSDLFEKDYRMIVLSAHNTEALTRETASTGLDKYFVEINGGIVDKIACIQEIAERNGFDPGETVIVGDMKHDIYAGKNLKAISICLTRGYQDAEILKQASPDYMVSDFEEMIDILEQG